MPSTRALWAVLLAAASALTAGCAGGDPDDAPSSAQVELAAGTGAIQGLLVDDRYRPLHLTDQPKGEFQAAGFILVVETGATVTSDADGVFQVLDLEPGTYTLKPAVDGHEGAPSKVDVAAGEYTEVDLLVRRLVTPGKDTVIIHDDTVLVTCQVQFLDAHFTTGRLCHGDLTSDGESTWVDYNYTAYDNVSAVVVEVRFSAVGDYEVWLTQKTNVVNPENLYAKEVVYQTDAFRYATVNGSEEGRFGGAPVDLQDLRVWVNVNGVATKETDDAIGVPAGVGFQFVVKARLVVSAFLEVPPDLDTYAVLS
ncbi:MAG TPA: carboxypeptidase-like regulatory domain-containing protein [Candidatus Thermoplasmatota archaeon]|nr:carboxypeptidase-like regulatory domain-containing protein [Candidatus Thermoplasmatota archaeon]